MPHHRHPAAPPVFYSPHRKEKDFAMSEKVRIFAD